MPYRAGPDLDETPPHDLVYGKMGQFALILGVVAASLVVAATVMKRSTMGQVNVPTCSFCCGVVTWLLSLSIATRVSLSKSVGRWWAISAIVIDLLLMFVVVYLVR